MNLLMNKSNVYLSKIYEIPNTNLKHIYKGKHYTIQATGGFSLLDKTHNIKINTINGIGKCDTTDTVQVLFPTDIINNILFDNTIRISSELFSNSITRESILCIGNIEEIYSDYLNDVYKIMGYHFKNSLLNMSLPITTETIYNSLLNTNTIKGEILIFDVKETLKNIEELNIFRNRSFMNSDSQFANKFANKFVAGDLIYIENGISIGLSVNMNYSNAIYELLKKKIKINGENNILPNLFEKQYQTGLLLRLF